MARPGLLQHRKFRRLARLLVGGSESAGAALALGSLELLWASAYESGNDYLGDSDDVEAAARWNGERGELTAAFVRSGGDGFAGFIEELSDRPGHYRVHDLFDHAPEYVQGRRANEEERKRTKVCVRCGREFRSPDHKAKYCKAACRSAAWREGKGESEDAPQGSARTQDETQRERSERSERSETNCNAPPIPPRSHPAPGIQEQELSRGADAPAGQGALPGMPEPEKPEPTGKASGKGRGGRGGKSKNGDDGPTLRDLTGYDLTAALDALRDGGGIAVDPIGDLAGRVTTLLRKAKPTLAELRRVSQWLSVGGDGYGTGWQNAKATLGDMLKSAKFASWRQGAHGWQGGPVGRQAASANGTNGHRRALPMAPVGDFSHVDGAEVET